MLELVRIEDVRRKQPRRDGQHDGAHEPHEHLTLVASDVPATTNLDDDCENQQSRAVVVREPRVVVVEAMFFDVVSDAARLNCVRLVCGYERATIGGQPSPRCRILGASVADAVDDVRADELRLEYEVQGREADDLHDGAHQRRDDAKHGPQLSHERRGPGKEEEAGDLGVRRSQETCNHIRAWRDLGVKNRPRIQELEANLAP
mmetsp:Transcript_1596/g.4327  ORF Transcript_1596/g.4327 Transcript_1596/m.4327 type:complete len:204 (-) Transcript_1596:983-1594(-)